jgi:hypothetical protein
MAPRTHVRKKIAGLRHSGNRGGGGSQSLQAVEYGIDRFLLADRVWWEAK